MDIRYLTELPECTNEPFTVLIQGDFGACYTMVSFSFEIGLIPVYSTKLREAVEEHGDDGTMKMVHRFKHKKYRKYEI